MSILHTGGRIEIRFGTGDMRVISAATKDTGIIGLGCAAPAPIGAAYPAEGYTSAAEHPVSLVFSDARSIDVVIDALHRIKLKMTAEEATPCQRH